MSSGKIIKEVHRRTALGIAAVCLLSISVLAHPGSGIVVDRLGQVYFLDTGSGLWKIDARGNVSHLSPLRNHWLAIDADDKFIRSRVPTDTGRDWVITAVSSDPTLLISTDFPLTIGQDGNLDYPSVRESNARLMRKSPTGGASAWVTFPRSVAGTPVPWINGITAASDGSIYYTEDNAIRRINTRGAVSTFAKVPALDHGPAIPGNDHHPYLRGLKIGANGTVYVADSGDARVLKITPNGKVITTLIQLESPWAPTDVALFGDVVYVLEFFHTAGDDRVAWMPRIRKITPDGRSSVILTVDQMPDARPQKPVASTTYDSMFADVWQLFFHYVFRFI